MGFRVASEKESVVHGASRGATDSRPRRGRNSRAAMASRKSWAAMASRKEQPPHQPSWTGHPQRTLGRASLSSRRDEGPSVSAAAGYMATPHPGYGRLPIFACACCGWGARPAASQCRLTTSVFQKNARTREADQDCLQLLAIRFTCFGAGDSCFQ